MFDNYSLLSYIGYINYTVSVTAWNLQKLIIQTITDQSIHKL